MTSRTASPAHTDNSDLDRSAAGISVAPRTQTPDPAPRLRQVYALARAEWGQLLNNKVALLNCFALPALMVFFFAGIGGFTGISFGALAPMLVLGTALLFVVYYTLVTSFVARRESLLLKRLRSGEAGDGVIVAGIAAPFVLITIAQTGAAALAAVLWLDVPARPQMALIGLAAVLGSLAWVSLAVASTGPTKSVEHAQITTLPMILVPLLLSGISLPLAMMPEAMQSVAHFAPMTPVVELTHLGMTGQTVLGETLTGLALAREVAVECAVLLGWTVIGWWVSRRTLRWESRS
ncbi:ABC-2 type transport system permease protein [Kineosphaera limosa]|uniref:Putative ABC transporter permease protein n=1 Tax=Kineosphaera limosa NBRC 100340 TaxID=1184609 RepID=K6WVA9_9MICO|nr:ABC transporter permease [Kineosphaera limosa]NYE02426.1 ABC-2 type transport system permease protein [Kineosphaera limosa]GAB96047.1 putative ABC transporter permease protein [Kineosphaera limosa NBRC 100340]